MRKNDASRDFKPVGNRIAMTAMHENRFAGAAKPAAQAEAKTEEK